MNMHIHAVFIGLKPGNYVSFVPACLLVCLLVWLLLASHHVNASQARAHPALADTIDKLMHFAE